MAPKRSQVSCPPGNPAGAAASLHRGLDPESRCSLSMELKPLGTETVLSERTLHQRGQSLNSQLRMPRSVPVAWGHRRLFEVTVRTRLPALLSLLALSESSLRRDTCDNRRPRNPAVSPREGSVPGVTLPCGGNTQGRDILRTEPRSFPCPARPRCHHHPGPPGLSGTQDSGGRSPAVAGPQRGRSGDAHEPHTHLGGHHG